MKLVSLQLAALMALLCAPMVDAQASARAGDDAGEMVESSPDWDTPPRFKRARGLPPLYPMSYIQGGKPGWAVVTYTVGTDGKSRDVVLESSSDDRFGRHVAAAIRAWPHHPARKSDAPVTATVTRKFSLTFD